MTKVFYSTSNLSINPSINQSSSYLITAASITCHRAATVTFVSTNLSY